ncbi:MAG: GNAT family N-acetyltransferase [Bryobacteraceae bacterium]|nr:GNAT family N-acetyltransferase [Bryobacteraceae bacterium]
MTPFSVDARRLEALEARANRETALAHMRLHPVDQAAVEEIAGGQAIFLGVGSPLTQVIGAGMGGAVGAAEMDRLEAFFRDRGAAVMISLCPLADFSLFEHIRDRGYRLQHFEHTLARLLDPLIPVPPVPEDIHANDVSEGERQEYVRLVMRGFEMPESPELLRMFVSMVAAEGSSGYLARVGRVIAGGAGLQIHQGAALFAGDGTLPEMRGRRVQSALIAHRLRVAMDRSCDLAAACVMPGSTSHRNYERAGFRVAYTKAIFAG